MSIVVFSFISGLRVGVKPDWYNYAWVFENFEISEIFNYSAYSKEPGYMAINLLIRCIYDSKYLLFYIIALTSITLTFISYFKMSSNAFVCILIYSSFFFINRDMGAIRAGLAYSFFLYGLTFYYTSTKKRQVLNFLSFTLHFTAILSFIVSIGMKLFDTRSKLIYMLLFSLLFYMSGVSSLVLEFFSSSAVKVVSTKATAYMGSEELTYDIGLLDATNLKNTFFSIVCILFYNKLCTKNKFGALLIFVYILGTSIRLAFSDLGVIAGRGYTIFNTVEPLIIASFYSILPKNTLSIMAYYLFVIIFGALILIMSIYKYETYPYINYVFS
ncbi:EpsG family protein [Pseudoalteromonas sp. S4389]|uniref:EpsG family protein n=1 Tax=Pseudoalteromonas sp. S4389 TaxID=579556 RepID=UPI0014869E21|nr:EpsG family protein [Pseudoalteromonas sp. S4389]